MPHDDISAHLAFKAGDKYSLHLRIVKPKNVLSTSLAPIENHLTPEARNR